MLYDAEEYGLYGSWVNANKAAANGDSIVCMFNLDMIAYDPDAPDIDVITNQASEWIVEAMLSTQKKYNIGPLLVNKLVNPEMIYSDHSPFWNHGWN